MVVIVNPFVSLLKRNCYNSFFNSSCKNETKLNFNSLFVGLQKGFLGD